MKRFLEDVDEQIQYQSMHAIVNEELQAHVEDKAETYMEYGVEEDEAFARAVRDMGDASAIGIQMNEAHRLRTAKPLLILLLILMALGMAGNFVNLNRELDWSICNRLGRITALSGSLALTLQVLFYFMGNIGYQFGTFGNLPFVSEGLVSITGSAVMAGLVLSAYRFDTVIKETA